MSFLTDAGLSWLKQKQELERLSGMTGPLSDAQDAQQAAMQQNVDAGLLSHMGNQYMDRLGSRTGLSAFGVGSGQAYKPWGAGGTAPMPGAVPSNQMPLTPPQPAPAAGQPVPFNPGQGVNAPAGGGGKKELLTLFAKMFGG